MTVVVRSIAFVFLLLLSLPFNSFSESNKTIKGRVSHVYDGDTIYIKSTTSGGVRIRLGLIDAPERSYKKSRSKRKNKKGQPFGYKSFKYLKSKIYNRIVTVKIIDKDDYNRLVGIVFYRGENINLQIVRDGYAWAYRKYLKGRGDARDYYSAEEKARHLRLGLWRQQNPVPPWKFKRRI